MAKKETNVIPIIEDARHPTKMYVVLSSNLDAFIRYVKYAEYQFLPVRWRLVCVAVIISATKEGVKFSTAGDTGTANIVCRQNKTVDKETPAEAEKTDATPIQE
ncbi:hypothetical protein VPH35_055458 [Triticum aestivum]|uniref:Proliferating cell nuclear antigen PCNA C-terminal domain-containing protein n=1 Tax=Triticum aestivum TaxID=4565 RepID=A0A077RQV7_WHEAT|nr:unnamed protein product [Triticum aestivum]